jgi:hypothetical protein
MDLAGLMAVHQHNGAWLQLFDPTNGPGTPIKVWLHNLNDPSILHVGTVPTITHDPSHQINPITVPFYAPPATGIPAPPANHAPTASDGADLGWVHNNDDISFTQWDLLRKVQAKDSDSSDRLEVTGLHVDPYYGTVDHLSDGSYRFTPNPGMARQDVPFTVEISDGHTTTTTHATLDVVAVQVAPAPPPAPAPDASPVHDYLQFADSSQEAGTGGAAHDAASSPLSDYLSAAGVDAHAVHTDAPALPPTEVLLDAVAVDGQNGPDSAPDDLALDHAAAAAAVEVIDTTHEQAQPHHGV